MWILAIIFLLIIVICTSSDRSRKQKTQERINEINRNNFANFSNQSKFVVRSDEDEMAELKRQAQEVADRTGATITGWGEVKTDENGQRYIECTMHTDDDDKIPEIILEQGKVFGDKIISSRVANTDKPATSNADEIAKWFDLKQKGAITEEEYQKQIKKYL